MPKSEDKPKISEKELKTHLFGWLWVEDNIMQDVREKLAKSK